MEEHLTELEPRLDVLGMGGDDRAVTALGVSGRASPPRQERLEEAPVVLGQPSAVSERLLGRLGLDVRARCPLAGEAQPVPREREEAVLGDGRLERLDRLTELSRAQVSLTLEIRFQRGKRVV